MEGSYNWLLVFASYCVAVIASYTAIYFGTRVFSLEGSSRRFWLAAGALSLGSGIWKDKKTRQIKFATIINNRR